MPDLTHVRLVGCNRAFARWWRIIALSPNAVN